MIKKTLILIVVLLLGYGNLVESFDDETLDIQLDEFKYFVEKSLSSYSENTLFDQAIATEFELSALNKHRTPIRRIFANLMYMLYVEYDESLYTYGLSESNTQVSNNDWRVLKTLDFEFFSDVVIRHLVSIDKEPVTHFQFGDYSGTRLEILASLKQEHLLAGNQLSLAKVTDTLGFLLLNIDERLAIREFEYALPALPTLSEAEDLGYFSGFVSYESTIASLAYAYANLGEYNKAIEYVSQVEELDLQILNIAVKSYSKLGRFSEAEKVLADVKLRLSQENHAEYYQTFLIDYAEFILRWNRQNENDISHIVNMHVPSKNDRSFAFLSAAIEYIELAQAAINLSDADFETAINNFLETRRFGYLEDNETNRTNIRFFEFISELYEYRKQHEQAYFYLAEYMNYASSIGSNDIDNKLLKFSSDIEQDLVANQSRNSLIKTQEKRIDSEHLRFVLSIVIAITSLLAIATVFFWQRQRKALPGGLTSIGKSSDIARLCDKKHGCIAMIDIDHFEHINKSYGQETGDEVLIGVTNLIKRHLRKTDLLYRYGGAEFLLFMDGVSVQDAQRILNKLRDKLRDKNSWGNENTQFIVDFSAGITEIKASETIESVIREADNMLDLAKSNGHGRTFSDQPI